MEKSKKKLIKEKVKQLKKKRLELLLRQEQLKQEKIGLKTSTKFISQHKKTTD